MASTYNDVWNLLSQYNNQIILDTYPEYLNCIICKKIIKDARQTECGCKCCRTCIEPYLSKVDSSCPGVGKYCKDNKMKYMASIQQDHKTNIEVSELKAKCPNDTCQFDGDLRYLPNHLKKCPKLPVSCPFKKIGCSSSQLTNETLNEHLQTNIQDHSIKMIDLLKSVEDKTFVFTLESKKNISTQTSMDNKLGNLNETVKKQKNTINELEIKLKSTNAVNDALMKEIEILSSNFEKVNFQVNDLTSNFTLFQNNCHSSFVQMKEQVTKKENESRKINEEQRRDMNLLKQELNSMKKLKIEINSDMQQLQKQLQPMNNLLIKQTFGEFIWKVDKFSEKIKSAQLGKNEEIVSSSFYSHKNGYKFQLKLYPNGLANGKGKFIVICFYILPGDFDDILHWPLRETIILSIINQETKEDYRRAVYNYDSTADRDRNIFNRQTANNVGFGSLNFVNIDNILKNHDVLKNDVLFVRCVVGVPELFEP